MKKNLFEKLDEWVATPIAIDINKESIKNYIGKAQEKFRRENGR